jgi:hypothetical protein
MRGASRESLDHRFAENVKRCHPPPIHTRPLRTRVVAYSRRRTAIQHPSSIDRRVRGMFSRLLKNADSSSSSPRKRSYGRLGMTNIRDLTARLKPSPFKSRAGSEFFSSLFSDAQVEPRGPRAKNEARK